VADSVEADTVAWVVTVSALSTPRDPAVSPPRLTALLEVSPNPFNAMLTTRFDFPPLLAGGELKGGLRLTIHDITGREVANLISSATPQRVAESKTADHRGAAEVNSVVWDASAVPAGVYFVRLQAGREISTKKVVLMR